MSRLVQKKPIAVAAEKAHGIGAIVERTFSNTTTRNSDGSRTQTVVFATTINIRKDKFGKQFVINYATKELRGTKIATWTLNGILLVANSETQAASKFAVWVYTGIEKALPKILWFIEGYQAFNASYSPFNLYQSGGKIEDKLTIVSTQFKDGHVYEKIKGTYSVWGKSPLPVVECYQKREGIV